MTCHSGEHVDTLQPLLPPQTLPRGRAWKKSPQYIKLRDHTTLGPSKSMKPPCILKGRPASAMREWLYDLPTSLYHHLKVPSNSSSPIVNGFYCPTLKAGICWNTCLRDHNFGGPRAAESPSSNDYKSGKAGEHYETYPDHVNINIP